MCWGTYIKGILFPKLLRYYTATSKIFGCCIWMYLNLLECSGKHLYIGIYWIWSMSNVSAKCSIFPIGMNILNLTFFEIEAYIWNIYKFWNPITFLEHKTHTHSNQKNSDLSGYPHKIRIFESISKDHLKNRGAL